MVKRYVVTGDPMESPYGHWVEYGEVKGLAERCERLEEALQILADYPLEEFSQDQKPDDRALFGANDWTLMIGDVKRARQAISP